MKDTTKLAAGAALVVFLIVLIVLWPLALVWALNTLFASLSIPYSFWSWLAVCVLNISTFGSVTYSINKLKEK